MIQAKAYAFTVSISISYIPNSAQDLESTRSLMFQSLLVTYRTLFMLYLVAVLCMLQSLLVTFRTKMEYGLSVSSGFNLS